MPTRRAATLLLTLLLDVRVAVGAEPQAPKLDALQPPTVAADAGPTARPLPRALTICIDRASRQCWSGEVAADCETKGGTVFATTPTDEGSPGSLLRSCWDEVK